MACDRMAGTGAGPARGWLNAAHAGLTVLACAGLIGLACAPAAELRPGLNGTYIAPDAPDRKAVIRFDAGSYARAACRVRIVGELVLLIPTQPQRFNLPPGTAFGFTRVADGLKLAGVVNLNNGGIMPSGKMPGLILRKQGP
ncbi:MAG: hypothetical protein ABIF71_04170 [Planctomycetota bacterium]